MLIEFNVTLQFCKSWLESLVDNKALYLNIQPNIKIVYIYQELQVGMSQSVKVYKMVLNTTQFRIFSDLKYYTVYHT